MRTLIWMLTKLTKRVRVILDMVCCLPFFHPQLLNGSEMDISPQNNEHFISLSWEFELRHKEATVGCRLWNWKVVLWFEGPRNDFAKSYPIWASKRNQWRKNKVDTLRGKMTWREMYSLEERKKGTSLLDFCSDPHRVWLYFTSWS